MRQTIIVSVLSAVVTVVLSVVVLNQLGAGTVSSAGAPDISAASTVPSSEDGQIQGDTDCDGDVDAVDGLGVLVNVVAFEALVQQEPCTDITNLIPAGDGVPGPQGPQGEQGPVGPQGEPGADGPAGVTEIELVMVIGAKSSSSGKFENAECPDGKKVLGGGIDLPNSYASLAVKDNRPHADLGGWFGQAHVADESNPPPFDWGVNVYAICANVAE